MKLIFREYLASLKERGELDVIMPDLLSELGFTVISRPAIGTKQHGVDVVAVSPDSDGNRSIHLISIKPGISGEGIGMLARSPSVHPSTRFWMYTPKNIYRSATLNFQW